MSPFQQHCTRQAEACASLGSPFTAQLCHLLGARLKAGSTVADRLLGWENLAADAVALRIAGGLHALAMANLDSALASAYPPHIVAESALWAAIEATLRSEAGFLLNWLDSPPQTNEIRRCSGLIPAFHWLAAQTGLPLHMSEIGASAGLNMNWDRYALHIGEQVWGPPDASVQLRPGWKGPPPPHADISITNKAGCDLNPIDPQNPESRARLHAYIWPDQPARHLLTREALAIAKTVPVNEDAYSFLTHRLAANVPGHLHIVYHSIVWQYLPAESQKACAALINAAGARATESAPLAWVSIEADHTRGSAAMRCTYWPGKQSFSWALGGVAARRLFTLRAGNQEGFRFSSR